MVGRRIPFDCTVQKIARGRSEKSFCTDGPGHAIWFPIHRTGHQITGGSGVDEIMLIPLYPQFAMATTETILVLAEKIKNEKYPELEFTVLPPFYNHPDYIRVLSQSIQEDLKHKKWEHLLFSYHGIPERHIRKSDITKSHCKIDKSCCQTTSKPINIAIVTSVMKPPGK